MLSVICPLYNEEKYIARCIDSILRQDYPKDDLEVLFIDGMSTDRSREIIQRYCDEYPFLHLLKNPHKIVPYAMNQGIAASKGEVIIRLDMHAEYDPTYFSTLVRYLKELDADNVGCVWVTDVLNKTDKTLAIKEVLSNKFGVGNASFRTGVQEIQRADTVPFGCFRRDVFEKYGLYNEKLVRNQDIELNKRIAAGGGKIYLIPQALCTYYARETYCAIAQNNYRNGLWNLLTVKLTRNFSSLSLRHFVPLAFLLSLVLPAIAAVFYTPLILISVLSLLMYLSLLVCVSAKIASAKKMKFGYLLLTFIVLHFSYGAGSFVGLFKTIK